jgi:protocatechuate 3,4-dioxygenase beta subunit
MMRHETRRDFFATCAALVLASSADARAQTRRVRPTPACGDDVVTPAQTPGPYFKPNSPMRTSLVDTGLPGTRLVVEGTVLSTDCKPVPRALLDVWQADARGDYDNSGYRLRGHLFTDDAGRYRVDTIVPGVYPGRTRHIHVIVQRPGGRPLTTQLYFPDEPENQRDGLFDPNLLVKLRDNGGVKLASFVFVLS